MARELNQPQTKSHLHAQIILRRNVNKHGWFLDKYTGTLSMKSRTRRTHWCLLFTVGVHCNYQVTKNDVAWNEYIKKGMYNEVMKNYSVSNSSRWRLRRVRRIPEQEHTRRSLLATTSKLRLRRRSLCRPRFSSTFDDETYPHSSPSRRTSPT